MTLVTSEPDTGGNSLQESFEGIIHQGVVESYAQGIARVRVIHDQDGGCAVCGARDGCGLAATGRGKPASIVEIPYANTLEKGQKVQVALGRNADWKATFFAFGLPIIMMLAGLAIGYGLGLPQLVTAFLSLACLVAYGFGLYLFRQKLQKTFSMTIISVE